jgi:hypothetical protein
MAQALAQFGSTVRDRAAVSFHPFANRSKNAFGLLMSLNMLIETPGGFDCTAADCIGWMKEAGFSNTHVEHRVGPDSIVV